MQHVTMISPATSDTSSFKNFTEIEPLEEELSELLVLDSLFPVVKILPSLTREENSGYYYVHGKIESSDLESLYNYAGRVGELTLGAEPDSSRLAPQALVRIAQLQDPNKPLFPLLHRLCIAAMSPSLDFLELTLSSALTTLELTAIPVDDPCYSSVLSFLDCAIHQAPQISTLILGPGLIQDQILDTCLRYKKLQYLELRDVGISITDQLLRDIGSLQDLETFIFRDNGTSTYTSSANPAENSSLFCALRTLEVDGTFYLIEDLAALVSSPDLRMLSIDITKSLDGIPKELFPEYDDVVSQTLAGCESDPFASHKKGKKSKKGTSSSFGLFQRPPSPPPPPPTPPPPPSQPHLSTTNIMTLLRRSIQKWFDTIVSVRFKNDSTISFWLPSEVFEDLLLHPDMKHLEVTGMDIDSMDGTLHRLKEVRHSKLEVLHLPVHSTAPDMTFARLREIAEACSKLKSLRCRLCIRDPSDIMASSPMSHQLGVISVSNGGQLEQHQLGVARYLDSIFPSLKFINLHDGNNTEQWRPIYDSVKSYQAVRMDEHRRLGLMPKGEALK